MNLPRYTVEIIGIKIFKISNPEVCKHTTLKTLNSDNQISKLSQEIASKRIPKYYNYHDTVHVQKISTCSSV